jgi:8-amino-7-oxononanoate synthase
MSLFDRWAAELERLRAAGRYRALAEPCGVDFSSNDYLGYAKLPHATPEEPDLARSGAASRLLRGQHLIWDRVEAALAAWHGAGAALMLTSGYVANEGLLSTVVEPWDWVASDALNHASLIDGLRLSKGQYIFPHLRDLPPLTDWNSVVSQMIYRKAERYVYRHCDLNHLEEGLAAAHRRRSATRQLFVVTESLFSMDGDVAPLAELAALARRYDAHLIVDEAHATGCFGPTGSGLVDAAGLRGDVLATVHTGGKALGVAGAYVCGSPLLRELLVNDCRHFLYTTALPPLMGAWWLEALARVRADDGGRAWLHVNARLFREELTRHGAAAGGAHYLVPVPVGADDRAVAVARRLQEAGLDVRAIRPPTVPAGTARLRVSVHADHTREELIGCAAAIAEALR